MGPALVLEYKLALLYGVVGDFHELASASRYPNTNAFYLLSTMLASNILSYLALFLPTLVFAQRNKQAYCDLGAKAPNLAGCFDIKDNGIKDHLFYGHDEWWSGNCRITISNDLTNTKAVSGKEIKEAIQNIIDTCDVGFEYIGMVRIEIGHCVIGFGGQSRECSSPLQHVRSSTLPDKREEGQVTEGEVALPVPQRRHLTDVPKTPNPDRVFARETSLYDGRVVCSGGPASAIIDACVELGEELVKQYPKSAPFPLELSAGGDCQVQIWPTTRTMTQFDSKHIALRIKEVSNSCADSTKSIIGFVSDYSADMFDGYHMFVGQFCGRFGSGYSGSCFPGGRHRRSLSG